MKKVGERVERYLIEGVLGQGGMGEVYEALDDRLGRRVALKLLPPDADGTANQRMLREARAAAAFEHPNVVVVYDVGEAEGRTYIAMELVRGKPLRAFVGDPEVPLPRRLRWLCDVADALAAAHAAGLVHRDVKPDNVMVRDDGRVKVLDFGIARKHAVRVDPSAPTEAPTIGTITEAGVVVGTPMYAAPEQLRSEDLDGRADQFAWGVMAYELLTGAPPWRANDSIALLSQILSADPESPGLRAKDLPPEVEAVVMRALQKRAEHRFPTMTDARSSLEPLAEAAHPPGRTQSVPAAASARPSAAKRIARGAGRLVVWGLATLGGLIVGLIVFAIVLSKVTGKTSFTLGPAKPLAVDALGCQEAKLEGDLAPSGSGAADIARAIGVGACARLATDIGVDWSVPDPKERLSVRAVMKRDGTEVILSVKDREASGKGATPIEAMVAATKELAKQLTPPPMTKEQIDAWGAKDEAGARRIERVWRRMVLNIAPNDEKAVSEVLESDPESPWPHIFAALIGLSGSERCAAERKQAMSLLDKLPPARASVLRGLLSILDAPAHRKEAMRLMRQGYADAPDDADVAGLFASIAISAGAPDEGFSVVDRLSTRFPTRSIVPLNNAIGNGQRDLERDRRYLERLHATLPESLAWSTSIQHLAREKKFDEARAWLAFGRKLGMGSAATGGTLDVGAVQVELAAVKPAAAREKAAVLMSDPSARISAFGAEATIASYLLEGRIVDAESAQAREIERQRSNGSPTIAASYAFRDLAHDRWLGRPPADPARLAWIEKTLLERQDAGPGALAQVRAAVALARFRADPKRGKRAAEEALAGIEALAEKESEGDRMQRDRILVGTVPLVRAVRGAAEAARRWSETDRAPFWSRRELAFEAALALEASGDRDGAEKAYLLAMDPSNAEGAPLALVAAHVRLAELYRLEGRAADAAALDGVVEGTWKAADPGLRAAILRLP